MSIVNVTGYECTSKYEVLHSPPQAELAFITGCGGGKLFILHTVTWDY